MIPRFASHAVWLLAIAFLISACASRDEGVVEESTSQSAATVPRDRPTFTPGATGSSSQHGF
jgi:PBP1b-binding outer membrane lipoprotein LpoB